LRVGGWVTRSYRHIASDHESEAKEEICAPERDANSATDLFTRDTKYVAHCVEVRHCEAGGIVCLGLELRPERHQERRQFDPHGASVPRLSLGGSGLQRPSAGVCPVHASSLECWPMKSACPCCGYLTLTHKANFRVLPDLLLGR
jgi:hypothetical protein